MICTHTFTFLPVKGMPIVGVGFCSATTVQCMAIMNAAKGREFAVGGMRSGWCWIPKQNGRGLWQFSITTVPSTSLRLSARVICKRGTSSSCQVSAQPWESPRQLHGRERGLTRLLYLEHRLCDSCNFISARCQSVRHKQQWASAVSRLPWWTVVSFNY